jgi:hypothetical protein
MATTALYNVIHYISIVIHYFFRFTAGVRCASAIMTVGSSRACTVIVHMAIQREVQCTGLGQTRQPGKAPRAGRRRQRGGIQSRHEFRYQGTVGCHDVPGIFRLGWMVRHPREFSGDQSACQRRAKRARLFHPVLGGHHRADFRGPDRGSLRQCGAVAGTRSSHRRCPAL